MQSDDIFPQVLRDLVKVIMRSFLITFEKSCWSSVRKQSNFADGTKLGGVVDRSDGCIVIQSDFDRLEKGVNRDFMKFQSSCHVLHRSGGCNFMNPSRLGAGQMESSFPGKRMDILVGKTNVSQQHPLQSELHFRRVFSQQPKGGGCSSLLSAGESHLWCWSSSGLPFVRGTY